MDRALQPDNATRRDQAKSSQVPATQREASNDPELAPKDAGPGPGDALIDSESDTLDGGRCDPLRAHSCRINRFDRKPAMPQ
jgi:hypothetical protein